VPATAGASLTQQAVTDVALKYFPGASVREAVLATVTDSSKAPPSRCVCSVVSLAPVGLLSQGPPGAPQLAPPGFLVAMIDARLWPIRVCKVWISGLPFGIQVRPKTNSTMRVLGIVRTVLSPRVTHRRSCRIRNDRARSGNAQGRHTSGPDERAPCWL
jgi:hypothetical protein